MARERISVTSAVLILACHMPAIKLSLNQVLLTYIAMFTSKFSKGCQQEAIIHKPFALVSSPAEDTGNMFSEGTLSCPFSKEK